LSSERPWAWSVSPEHEERFSTRGAPLGTLFDSPRRIGVVDPTSFDEGARAVADLFKRRQPVILNLQRSNGDLTKRMVDFCAGLTYALDGCMYPIADRLFLLTPHEVEVSSKESSTAVERAFFNQL
jgi:cell division inhibitor SepF